MNAERAQRPWWPVAYPIVLVIAFLVLLLVSSGASFFAGTRMILVGAVLATLLTVVAGTLMRDRHRGGLVALAVVLLILTGTQPAIFAALVAGIVLLVVERLASLRQPSRTPWPVLTRALNAIAVVVVIAVAIKGVQEGAFRGFVDDVANEGPAFLRSDRPADASNPTDPDIYVLLLDGYARDDKLLDLFGYDNGPFLAELRSRGFDISSGSRSNYLLTAVSLSSALNMRQLTGETSLAALPVGNAQQVREARHLINGNAVFHELHARGYETIGLASGFEEVALRNADRFVDTGQINEVEFAFFRQTLAGSIMETVDPDYFADEQRARIDSLFSEVAKVAAEPHDRPRFVFVHVPSPHAPIVYGADGSHVAARDLATFYGDRAAALGVTQKEYGDRYTGQIAYLNRHTLDTIDALVASFKRPTALIVMSDHGSASGFRPEDLVGSDLDERSANLLAARTPDHPKVFGDSISLVNVFGTLFDAYFGTHHPHQPDTVYRWEGASIFNLVPVEGIAPGGREP